MRGAVGEKAGADPALKEICQIYWRPIYGFIFSRGYSEVDAQDLTQDFFVMIIEGNFLETVDRERGRFRSILLRTLKNFLIDASVKRRRHKRGGQVEFVSWDRWMADAPSQLSLPAAAVAATPPEVLFDAGWAAAIAEEALRRLRLECESKGRRRIYAVLHPHLTSERSDVSYDDLARELGVSEVSVKSLLHHFRVRYRILLREEIAKTLKGDSNVNDEIRYLCANLGATAR